MLIANQAFGITIAKDQSLKPNNFLSTCLDAVKAKFPNTFFGWHYKLPHEQQLLENEEYIHLQLSKDIRSSHRYLPALHSLHPGRAAWPTLSGPARESENVYHGKKNLLGDSQF